MTKVVDNQKDGALKSGPAASWADEVKAKHDEDNKKREELLKSKETRMQQLSWERQSYAKRQQEKMVQVEMNKIRNREACRKVLLRKSSPGFSQVQRIKVRRDEGGKIAG